MPSTGLAAHRVLAVVPARYASTRFPGKPLADLAGVPMIVRVIERARLSSQISQIVCATDDERIAAVVRAHGSPVVMTSPACASGTDRVAETVRALGFEGDLVVNVQGDEPLLDPTDLDVLIDGTLRAETDMGTLCRPIDDEADRLNPNVVKVVRDLRGRALYFSRAPIPGARHVGLYSYRPKVLQKLSELPPTWLETTERLEQLRALENGISIAVIDARSKEPAHAVDTPEDAAKVIALLMRRP